MSPTEPVEDGQFDDAPEDALTVPAQPVTQPAIVPVDPRGGHTYIDDDAPQEAGIDLDWSDEDDISEDEDDEDEFEDGMARVEDEDWEIAERGMRAHQGYSTILNRL